ncbi:unnamed protein product [Clonostachys byssicola]|uniref:CFEM domain-containing protein n=1 Tax=Clonostachys byssicola TaxID=160290 RepID=A0A9N9Y0U1_9HYPO|nr:unnamed protein product [Clonostachys byssicola]
MKFSLVAILFAAVAAVNAKSRPDIPKCVRPCLEEYVKKSKIHCPYDDIACICKHALEDEAFYEAGLTCIFEKCGTDDALSAFPPLPLILSLEECEEN